MKRFIPIILAATVLTFAGCSKDDQAQVPDEIKSYTMELVQSGVVSVRHQNTPTFDAEGRLSSLVSESFMLAADGTVKSSSKSTVTYAFDESSHSAVETMVMEGELSSILDGPAVMDLSFDSDWKLVKTYFEMLESTETFEYDGDRMIRYITGGINHETPFNITWKDGDIVSIVDESATVTITYLPEKNPFKKGIDLTLDNLLPNQYTFRMTGRHSAHLPATYTNASKSVTTYKYEYKTDKYGRITEIAIKGEGETSHKVIRIQY